MLRNIILALIICGVAVAAFLQTKDGREVVEEVVNPDRFLSRDEVVALYGDGATWCFWPDEEGRCEWATSAKPMSDAFEATVYAEEGETVIAGRPGRVVSAARSGLIWRGEEVCEDPTRPINPAWFGFYDDESGFVQADAPLRRATRREFELYLKTVPDTGDGEVCFRYEEVPLSPLRRKYRQHATLDGEPFGEPGEFVVIDRGGIAQLKPRS